MISIPENHSRNNFPPEITSQNIDKELETVDFLFRLTPEWARNGDFVDIVIAQFIISILKMIRRRLVFEQQKVQKIHQIKNTINYIYNCLDQIISLPFRIYFFSLNDRSVRFRANYSYEDAVSLIVYANKILSTRVHVSDLNRLECPAGVQRMPDLVEIYRMRTILTLNELEDSLKRRRNRP